MSPQRVIRPGARRSRDGVRPLLWTAAAAALPVVVTALVLTAVTLAVLVIGSFDVGDLLPVVGVEWFVLHRVPLAVDAVTLGVLPLLPALLYVVVLARQTRVVLADVEDSGYREAAAAVAGVVLTAMALTGLATFLVGSASSDFAVRERSIPEALAWSAVVAGAGAVAGAWWHLRPAIRRVLPEWVRGGLHLGLAFTLLTWAIGGVLVVLGLLTSWGEVGDLLAIGRDAGGVAALALISVGYLPNAVALAGTLGLGGEAHLGEASYSVFAVSRGPLPEIPLSAALPASDPHWSVQVLLLLTAVAVALLARTVAHWFPTTTDGVKAAWLAAAVAALVTVLVPVVAGGELGLLGEVGTGALIAGGMALLLFGVIGSLALALSLAGLTRRREREERDLERRRARAGLGATATGAGAGAGVAGAAASGGDERAGGAEVTAASGPGYDDEPTDAAAEPVDDGADGAPATRAGADTVPPSEDPADSSHPGTAPEASVDAAEDSGEDTAKDSAEDSAEATGSRPPTLTVLAGGGGVDQPTGDTGSDDDSSSSSPDPTPAGTDGSDTTSGHTDGADATPADADPADPTPAEPGDGDRGPGH